MNAHTKENCVENEKAGRLTQLCFAPVGDCATIRATKSEQQRLAQTVLFWY